MRLLAIASTELARVQANRRLVTPAPASTVGCGD